MFPHRLICCIRGHNWAKGAPYRYRPPAQSPPPGFTWGPETTYESTPFHCKRCGLKAADYRYRPDGHDGWFEPDAPTETASYFGY
jgi:hypothetical protein